MLVSYKCLKVCDAVATIFYSYQFLSQQHQGPQQLIPAEVHEESVWGGVSLAQPVGQEGTGQNDAGKTSMTMSYKSKNQDVCDQDSKSEIRQGERIRERITF